MTTEQAELYTKGDAFQAEKIGLFSAEWLPLCAEGQIARPGDFLSAGIGGWNVIGVRDGAGTVRVLRNACRHQNMPVVAQSAGTCETFRCRFHGWTYDLAGKFLGAPPPVAPATKGPELDLHVLPSVEWGGLIFFTLGEPGALPQFSAPAAAYSGTTITDMACNWKIVAEELKVGMRHGALLVADGDTLHQIVPHTFLRTRLFSHGFGAVPPTLDALKETCEARQKAYAGSS